MPLSTIFHVYPLFRSTYFNHSGLEIHYNRNNHKLSLRKNNNTHYGHMFMHYLGQHVSVSTNVGVLVIIEIRYLEIHFNRNYHKQLENLFYGNFFYLYVK